MKDQIQTDRERGHPHRLALLALVIIVILLSLPTLKYGYLLEEYKYLRSYSLPEIGETFISQWEPTGDETRGYRPGHSVHYAFFHFLIGGKSLPNHILQILLLMTIGILLYFMVFSITGKSSPAFWSSLLYLCLGTTGWQVSWLSCRHQLIQVILLITCLLYYNRYLLHGYRGSWWASFFSFIFALLLKEPAVIFPFLLLAWAVIIRQNKLLPQIKPLIPFFIVLGIFLCIRATVVKTADEVNILPPPLPTSPLMMANEYFRSLLATCVQSQGVVDPLNDFPVYCTRIATGRDFIGLFSFIGLCGIGGVLLTIWGKKQEKQGCVFGLIILLLATVMVAAWYRSNRLFISSVGIAMIGGIVIAVVFRYLHRPVTTRRALVGGAALICFIAYLAVNLSVFYEIQRSLRPHGFLALTWDKWAYEDYIPWMKEEQLRILSEKLKRTGRSDWAEQLPLK